MGFKRHRGLQCNNICQFSFTTNQKIVICNCRICFTICKFSFITAVVKLVAQWLLAHKNIL